MNLGRACVLSAYTWTWRHNGVTAQIRLERMWIHWCVESHHCQCNQFAHLLHSSVFNHCRLNYRDFSLYICILLMFPFFIILFPENHSFLLKFGRRKKSENSSAALGTGVRLVSPQDALLFAWTYISLELRIKMFGSLLTSAKCLTWKRQIDLGKYRLSLHHEYETDRIEKKEKQIKKKSQNSKVCLCTKAKRYCFQTVTSNGNNNWFKNHCVCRYVDFVLKKCCLNLCFISYFPSASENRNTATGDTSLAYRVCYEMIRLLIFGFIFTSFFSFSSYKYNL